MRSWLLAFLLCLCAPLCARADPPAYPCLRFLQPDQRWILQDGVRVSPTLRDLAGGLCETDIIAYVRIDLKMRPGVAGTCALLGSSAVRRMVSIRLSGQLTHAIDLIATLSHELEHALEIAHAPWVRHPADIMTLQRLLAPNASHAPGPELAEARTRRELASARLMFHRR
jgi:hypothetical protein